MALKDITKYHINTFTTGITATVVAILFYQAYISKGISPYPLIFIIFGISLLFIGVVMLIIKPKNLIKRSFPDYKFLLVNSIAYLLICFLFIKTIGLGGLVFAMAVSLLLLEVEHILSEALRK